LNETPNAGQQVPVGRMMYECFHEVFEYLPFAALVENRILVLHGGIGNGEWTLDDLQQHARPIRDEQILTNDMLYQILWSDPDAADDEMQRGVHPNPRGGPTVIFTTEVTESFCYRNGLTHVIRGHQYVPEGVRIMHNGKLLTVFSARNYVSKVKNDGALILVCKDEEKNVRLKVKLLRQMETEL
jgi:diadenosine tetraphosphatase ApaH/serine/threonine PP2A family protein phosphatase